MRGFNSPCIAWLPFLRSVAVYTMSGQLARQTSILRTNTLSRTSLSQRVRATAPWRLVITAIISPEKSFGPINSKCFYSGYFVLVAGAATTGLAAPTTRSRPFFRYNCFVYRPQSERPILAYTQTMSFSTLFYIYHWSTLRSLSFTAMFAPFAFFSVRPTDQARINLDVVSIENSVLL